MGYETGIEWTDHTWSPWIGCTKKSPGCLHCYAETLMDSRFGKVNWGRGNPRLKTKSWEDPVKWNREFEECCGVELCQPRPTIFPSLCDWLDPEVPIALFAEFLCLLKRTPNVVWLLLTKSPEEWRERMQLALLDARAVLDEPGAREWAMAWLDGSPPDNVAVGTSCENQHYTDWRLPDLIQIPAWKHFVSFEPIIGPIVSWPISPAYLSWVITGGESGDKFRTCTVDWIEDVSRHAKLGCRIPTFVKQDCGLMPGRQGRISNEVWAWKDCPFE